MKNSNKKGFTIVELVIVIAVIAILAAVLIPTFSSLIKKANLSADQVAVKNMNTVLATEFATENPASLKEVVDALDEAGFNVNSLTPLTKDYEFHWSEGTKTIVLVDASGAIIYPEKPDYNAEKKHNLADGVSYMNVEVDSAEALMTAILSGSDVTLSADIANAKVTIAAGDDVTIDLNGHTITAEPGSIYAVKNEGTLTITGNGEIKGGYSAVYNTGNITIEGGTFTATEGFGLIVDNIYGTEPAVAVINGGIFTGVGIYNPTVVTINGGTFEAGRDPDGATDGINEDGLVTLFISPTFVGAPNTADVTLNGGTFNGDIYVYDDGITETNFVNNGATITGEILDNA